MKKTYLKVITAISVIIAIGLFSCKTVKTTTSSTTTETKTPLTYKTSISTILTSNCGGCHASGRKIDMTTYATVKKFVDNGELKQTVIIDKSMPQGSSLEAADYAKIKMWLEAGAPE